MPFRGKGSHVGVQYIPCHGIEMLTRGKFIADLSRALEKRVHAFECGFLHAIEVAQTLGCDPRSQLDMKLSGRFTVIVVWSPTFVRPAAHKGLAEQWNALPLVLLEKLHPGHLVVLHRQKTPKRAY